MDPQDILSQRGDPWQTVNLRKIRVYVKEGVYVGFVQSLLQWYDHNKRDLPWRKQPTPYTTLVSEIMLQQTRVEAVLPLYLRFIERFPTVQDLAAASQDEVLTYWQGLGYYSRARRLHQAAQVIVTEHDGIIPREQNLLRTLPGIGDYTCGAILSMAYGKPHMAIDGNLLRIGSRLFLVYEPINKASAKRLIQEEYEVILPKERPGDFNQALMDLGSAICLPKNPRCSICPIHNYCQAFLQGQASELPRKDAAKPPIQVHIRLYLVESNSSILLRQRQSGGFLQGMWELPWFEMESELGIGEIKVAEEHWLPCLLNEQAPLEIRKMEYVFSHRHWFMTVCHYHVKDEFYFSQEHGVEYRWQPREALDEIALPTVFKKALHFKR